jgi:hypothetical protein
MNGRQSRRDFLKAAAGAACVVSQWGPRGARASAPADDADLILLNGRIATFQEKRPFATAVSIKGGLFQTVGSEQEIMAHRGDHTQVIDLGGRTVIPGLDDSHIHVIRGGLNYNMELRWDGVPSLADALRMLRDQAQRTPPPQWVRVVGGWSEFQFAERRMPTLEEINAAASETPVFVLHLYDRAFLNRAALRVLGYSRDTPDPPGAEIQRDARGNPAGLIIAKPNPVILYASLARGPKLSYEEQLNSSRHFMRELNRLGVTSAIDAGGGFQNYPEDYAVITDLARQGLLTVRIAYNLFTQSPKEELEDFSRWIQMTHPGKGDDFLRMNGAGEMLVFSAADFEDFLEPRPDPPSTMEAEKGSIEAGKLADLAVLSEDYFSVSEERMRHIEAVLTVVGGKVVYGAKEFARHSPPPLPLSPSWSPVGVFGGYRAETHSPWPRLSTTNEGGVS